MNANSMLVGSARPAGIVALLAAWLACFAYGCQLSQSDDRTVEIRLDAAGITLRVPEGFKLADERRIVDPEGDVSLFYTFADEQAPNTTQIDLSVARDDEGVVTYFDAHRPLDEQLMEEANALSLAGYEVEKAEVRTLDGRPALEIKARNSTDGIFRAFIPMGSNGSVSILGATESDSGRQELLFDTVLETLRIE